MFKKVKILLVVFLVSLVTFNGFSQDNTFTQFFSSPMTLNPALTGNYKGNYRFYVINRSQWRNVLDNNIRAYAASFDLKFKLKKSYKTKDFVGFGFLFFHDEAGLFEYSTNSMMVSGAYHKGINPKRNHYISVGFNIMRSQKNINFNELTFEDQFNLSNAYSLTSNEAFPDNNFSHWDSTLGINYSIAPTNKSQLNAGLSAFHVFGPNASFYDGVEDVEKEVLKRRFTGYINYQFPLDKFGTYKLSPRFVGSLMGKQFQTKWGTNLRVLVSDHKKMALHFGSWVNLVGDNVDPFKAEAIVGVVGFELRGVLLGVSYDYGLTALGSGAFEVSIGYLGEYETDDHDCPKF